MGLPGAGKGTQASKLAVMKQLPHISTGEMFRTAIKEETPLGLEVCSYTNAGKFVPDEITIRMIEERLKKEDCSEGFILDGFPRTVPQAEALDNLMSNLRRSVNVVVYIDVDQTDLVKRLTGRRSCKRCGANYHLLFSPPEREGFCYCGGELYQREDDTERTVAKRLEVSTEEIKHVLSYYESEGVLEKVDGSQPIQDVTKSILECLQVIQK